MINKLFLSTAFMLALSAMAAALQPLEAKGCSALIKSAGAKLEVIRSGDLIGDGSREFVAIQRIRSQSKKGLYISRLLIARLNSGRCSVELDAGKDGPRNPLGYVGISYIDDGDSFYGYKFGFGSDLREAGPGPRYKCVLFLDWLNSEHETEGAGLVIGWNEKLKRFQEIDGSWEFFNPELPHPPHRNSRNCGKCTK
ncbi:MAG TPA: hypothetical protein VGK22_05475 [Candidatus Angelobacter sp.]|jgi:hypothetical protein